jgi:hypothetical protein
MKSNILRKRSGKRGAALVEAAVVIPVMLMFLGLIMFTHKSYAMKMDKQMATRSQSMSYASRACDGEKGELVSESSEDTSEGNGGLVGQQGDQAQASGDKLRDSEKGGLDS